MLSRRNVAVFAVMVAAFAWFWLWHLQLTESTLLLTAGSLIALPLTLQESESPARERTVSVTRRDLVLAFWALVVLVDLYYAYGQTLNVLMASASSCLWCWRRRGRGAHAAGWSNGGSSVIRSAATYDLTWSRP